MNYSCFCLFHNKRKIAIVSWNANVLDNNYELAINKAKEYGVYDQARQEAVREYREQGKKKAGK